MSARGIVKGAAIIAGTVVVLSTLLAAGVMLFLFGATIGFIFLSVVIVALVIAAMLEAISERFKSSKYKHKPKQAQQ